MAVTKTAKENVAADKLRKVRRDQTMKVLGDKKSFKAKE